MPITESHRALGTWSLRLSTETPRAILDRLGYLGHITVHTGEVDPRTAGDGLLATSRYTGVVRGKGLADDAHTLSGAGMALWLGDEDGKGAVIETALSFAAETFTQTVRDLLPASGAVTEGTLHAVAGTYTNTHQYQSPRQAIDYVCDTMGAEWRVNGDATLDAGLAADLFATTPVAAIIRRDAGVDMDLRALTGAAGVTSDVEDFTTRVVLLAEGEGSSIATGSADIAPGLNTYKDLHGNTVVMTRLVSESDTSGGNADVRAQLQLNRFTGTRDALALSTPDYDVKGSAATGDYVWVHDPDIGLVDLNNEVMFRGLRLYPVKLRVSELTWPVVEGSTVAYRDSLGAWLDLTPYVVWETDSTTVVVGEYNRSLTNTGSEPVGSRPIADSSIPAAPVWVVPFVQSTYQSSLLDVTKARVNLVWTRPLNTDGSTIVDGDHFEIRYRTSGTSLYPSTWDDMEAYTWDQLEALGGTWDQVIPLPVGDWHYLYVNWDQLQFLVQELTPGVPYDFEIRAVDIAGNASAFSSAEIVETVGDTIAPSTPAPPTVASSLIAVQVTHTLGVASGGTYNLEPDLHHLEVHAQYTPHYTPNDSTLIGKMLANVGMMISQIPVIATFAISSTASVYIKVIAVDKAGNKSLGSAAVGATATLIDNAHISDLSVSKLTAGTVTASYIHAGWMRVGAGTAGSGSGPAIEITPGSIQAISPAGALTFDVEATTGVLRVLGQGGIKVTGGGNVEITNGALIVKNAGGAKIIEIGECADGRHGMQVYTDLGVRTTRIGELAAGGHGIEVIDEANGNLVKISTLAFGTQSADASGFVSTSANFVWTDLGGPQVSAVIGNTGRAIVIVTAWLDPDAVASAVASFEVVGISSATFARAVLLTNGFGENNAARMSAASLVTGLSAGTKTFKMMYTSNNVFSGFSDRSITVIPF